MWNKLFPLIYERYLAKQIYLSFIFILIALVSLFIFFDFIAEINDTSNTYTFLLAFTTVIFKIPSRIVEIMPIAALIGAIYVCANLAAQSEYTIFRVAGLQPKQALQTLLKIAIPIALATLIMSEFIGPIAETISKNIRVSALNAGQEKLDFKSGAWIKDKRRDGDGNGAIKEGTRYINVGSFENTTGVKGFRMYEFDEKNRLINIRIANSVKFINSNQWELKDVTETSFKELSNTSRLDPSFQSEIKKVDRQTITTEVNPQLLGVLLIKPDRMSLLDLFGYIHHLRDNKQDYQRYAIAFWKKLIYPFTVLVMLALALPFAYLQTRSGGIGYKVFGGIMLGISFQLFNSLFSHLGLLAEWPSLVSAITPAALYFILALTGIRWVSKT
jgi:lipopolysaccharide export system permease protein